MVTVAALYHFAEIADPAALRAALIPLCRDAGLTGTLILAGEGINGTVAGPAAGVGALIARLRALPGLAALRAHLSETPAMPFKRMKVRIKREIVTMGVPGADPRKATGRRVAPGDWDALIRDRADIVLIDMRNRYEIAEGTFAGAIDPGTRQFREFPAWWAAHRDRFAGRPVAMFCTGGIRCERASSLLVGDGVAEVFQLDGGILGYLRAMGPARSSWQGRCFVFDGRGNVGAAEA